MYIAPVNNIYEFISTQKLIDNKILSEMRFSV